ncbi:hypothetical protein ACFO0N_18560 [Halobium salinum]|uniref:Lipoprotein n=1 Tax=Halobium salinum TaxID=1364940 RepID=A0ABD5PGV9_9EURY|nr:hypothetical protein [Halobium salinum]
MSSDFGRRRLLALSAGALAVSAGCSALRSEEPPEPYVMGELSIANGSTADRAVSLLVEHDDEILLWERYELRGQGGARRYSKTVGEDLRCETGPFTLSARVHGTGARKRYRTDNPRLRTHLGRSGGMEFRIEEEGGLTLLVSYHEETACREALRTTGER